MKRRFIFTTVPDGCYVLYDFVDTLEKSLGMMHKHITEQPAESCAVQLICSSNYAPLLISYTGKSVYDWSFDKDLDNDEKRAIFAFFREHESKLSPGAKYNTKEFFERQERPARKTLMEA